MRHTVTTVIRMNTLNATNKVNKYFSEFEKSSEYQDILTGTMGNNPMPFNNIKLSDSLTMNVDVQAGRKFANGNEYIYDFWVSNKEGEVVATEKQVMPLVQSYKQPNFSLRMALCKRASLMLAKKIDKMGLVK